jgi:hypothetical protein
MAVVVTVAWGVPGRGDHGREEVFRGALLFLEENLVDEAFEDSPLLLQVAWSAPCCPFEKENPS